MSFNKSFKKMDIHTLSLKLRRLEDYFKEDSSHMTDHYLELYHKINERIKELKSRPTRSKQKQIVIENYLNLISSLETYFEIWKRTDGGTTGHLIGSSIKRIESLMEIFKSKG
jgi:hypothetical protein